MKDDSSGGLNTERTEKEGAGVDPSYPGPSNEPCVMGYLVKCPHLVISRVMPGGEHHACVHWPRCERSIFVCTPESLPVGGSNGGLDA